MGDKCTHFFHETARIDVSGNKDLDMLIDDHMVEHKDITANNVEEIIETE